MRSKLFFWTILGVLALATDVLAADVTAYNLVKEKSSVKFFAIQNSAPVEGKFNDFSADIHFDSKQLDKSNIVGEVKMASLEIGNPDVDKNLRLPEWLSIDAFPKATFRTKKIIQMPSSENYYAEGEITLRGKTKPTTLNFQLAYPSDTSVIAKGFFTLHRRDFGIGQGEWAKDDVVKDEVRVEFRIFAEKK